jgi:hypothetical protein
VTQIQIYWPWPIYRTFMGPTLSDSTSDLVILETPAIGIGMVHKLVHQSHI